jgi:hypothetical protein
LLAGLEGDEARRLLHPTAQFTWTVDAENHFDAMTADYKFMGNGEYTTPFEEDHLPHPDREPDIR